MGSSTVMVIIFHVGTIGSKEKCITFAPSSFMTSFEKIKELLYNFEQLMLLTIT